MKYEIINPTKCFVENPPDDLHERLTYTNTANQHLLKRWAKNHWAKAKDPVGWDAELKRLQGSIINTLIFKDENEKEYIRPGSIPYLGYNDTEIVNHVNYPTPKPVAWVHMMPFEFYDYQKQSVERLLATRHANVALCTGAGKSAIILKYCRDSGFRTAIIAPSTSIFDELYDKFEHHLGRVHVGRFGDGKKILDKKFTICIGDSLVNIEPGTEEWDFFSNLDAIVVDESHTWGADTLDTLCHGLFANVPCRVFVSGTQTRGDGTTKLLQSIIGPTVAELSTAEAIQKGYICNHDFRIVDIESSNPNYQNADILKMKRAHLLNNKNIAAFIAKFANAMGARGQQTLVLVQELSQIALLIPLLTVPFDYAHSQTSKKELREIGLEKADKAQAVEKFNKNEIKVLIGTSCISTGTNIFPTHNTFNWIGGSSEITTKQGAVGRSVRLHDHNPWKDKCALKTKSTIWDFYLCDIPALDEQLKKRLLYYQDSGTEIKRITSYGKNKTTGALR